MSGHQAPRAAVIVGLVSLTHERDRTPLLMWSAPKEW